MNEKVNYTFSFFKMLGSSAKVGFLSNQILDASLVKSLTTIPISSVLFLVFQGFLGLELGVRIHRAVVVFVLVFVGLVGGVGAFLSGQTP